MLTAPWDPSSYLAQMHQLQQFQEAQVNTYTMPHNQIMLIIMVSSEIMIRIINKFINSCSQWRMLSSGVW